MKTHASPINLSVICRLATDTISFTVKISYYTTTIINKLILTTEFVALTEQLWEKNRVKRSHPRGSSLWVAEHDLVHTVPVFGMLNCCSIIPYSCRMPHISKRLNEKILLLYPLFAIRRHSE
jgi:hypothetical protein